MVSVDVKHHVYFRRRSFVRAQELYENRGGPFGLPVPNTPCGFCGLKQYLKKEEEEDEEEEMKKNIL